MTDLRRYSASAARNREPLHTVLHSLFPSSGTMLEIASGTGEHCIHFAAKNPLTQFQPSDPSPDSLESIKSWIELAGVDNVLAPVCLDVTEPDWPITSVDMVYCSNMIHIAPWQACQGLISGAGRILRPGNPLVLYGPFFRENVETAPGNLAFDTELRGRNPDWGVRRLEAVSKLARDAGFAEPTVTEMPANNLCVCFHRI